MSTASLHTAPRYEPQECVHAVHFYRDDDDLVRRLAPEISEVLNSGGAVVMICTPEHRKSLAEQIKARGVDLGLATEQGRYIAEDAEAILGRFVSPDRFDELPFRQTIREMLTNASKSRVNRGTRLLAFGEMVAVLWDQGMPEAALRLEGIWNDLLDERAFTLLCAYPMSVFQRIGNPKLFEKVCDEHTHVYPSVPAEPLTEDNYRRAVARMQEAAQALESERALRRNEERFRLSVETVQDYAIFLLDPGGYITSWNAGARRIKGYTADEILGKHFSCFYPEGDICSGKPEMELKIAAQTGGFEDEGWRVRRDGSRFWADVIITAVRDQNGKLVGFAKVTRDWTDRMKAQKSLEESRDALNKDVEDRITAENRLKESETSLRSLSRTLFQIQDDERRHLGRELHDSIGQYLSALKMELDSMKFEPALKEKAVREQLDGSIGLVEQCIKEVRTMSYLLYPPLLEEMGLKMAVPWYLDGFSKRSGIQTRLQISSDFGRLPRDFELVLFRVLQECLTNVHRHSGSQTATVKVFIENNTAVLEVCDAGRGLPVSVMELGRRGIFNTGVGLRAMHERLRAAGGSLELFSAEQGTTARASIPCAKVPEGVQ